jgi:transmembrane sensor
MSRIVELRRNDGIKEEAAAWIARLDSESMSASELAGLRSWIARSPEHRQAIEELAELWDRLDVLEACRPPARERKSSRPVWTAFAAAAGLGAVALAVWLIVERPGGIESVPAATETAVAAISETAVGEQKTVPLPDGSSVRLNTNSRIEVRYSDQIRRIGLIRGEAYFEVASQVGRPFVVETQRGTVTAIGTAFSVRVDAKAVEVTVQKGRVEVARKTPPARLAANSTPQFEAVATLDARQSVVFDESIEAIDELAPEQLVRELAWRDGMLIFEGDALTHVVAEVARYDNVEIVISDPELRNRRIGGYFRTGETDVLLAALEGSFGIEVERVSDTLIYLHPTQQ